MEQWTLFFDGACEPRNPGGWMGWAWSLHAGGKTYSGHDVRTPARKNTNNAAEWFGCGCGLAAVRGRLDAGDRCDDLLIVGDSMLVTHQLTDYWACRAPLLRLCRARCLRMLDGLRWRTLWVRREYNDECDALSKRLIVERGVMVPDRPKPGELDPGRELGVLCDPAVPYRDRKRYRVCHRPALERLLSERGQGQGLKHEEKAEASIRGG